MLQFQMTRSHNIAEQIANVEGLPLRSANLLHFSLDREDREVEKMSYIMVGEGRLIKKYTENNDDCSKV